MKIQHLLSLAQDSLTNYGVHGGVAYVSENQDWVIKQIGVNLQKELSSYSINFNNTVSPFFLNKYQGLHFGSINALVRHTTTVRKISNLPTMVTWFHVVPNDPLLPLIPDINKLASIVHTASEITRQRLQHYGLPSRKIKKIPLGIDLSIFRPLSDSKKKQIKENLRLPLDRYIVGSFQKDGNGWGKGDEPKLIKGPDLFCDAVIKIAQYLPIHVLLTGPARGYVKKRMQSAGIPYTHQYVTDQHSLNRFYNCLDLYVIASREEGGPYSVLETQAAGVPLVSTRVGMAPEVITHNRNGFLVDSLNTDLIAEYGIQILKEKEIVSRFKREGQKIVENYSWKKIAKRYYQELYIPLLEMSHV